MADAGWYPDAHDANLQHYFDGQNWTGHRRPNPTAAGTAAPAAAPVGSPVDDTVRRGDLPSGPWGRPEPQWAEPEPQWAQPEPQWAQPEPQQPWAQPEAQQHPQQQWAQPAAQWGGPPPWTPSAPGAGTVPGPALRRRRTPLLVAGVAAVVVIAGVVTWLVWPDSNDITYQGKDIAQASATLSSAEKSVATAVATRHGAKNGDTRCYFAKPKKAKAGTKDSDVESSLRCGPVLFVDGERSASYLSVPLTREGGGSSAKLTASDDLADADPSAIGDVNLVRPDGKTPPSGNGTGDLKVPDPPAAAKDVIATASLDSSVTPTKPGTKVVGKYLGVTLTAVAEIKRYGSGDDARSAPSGQRLIAFKLDYGPGDVGTSDVTHVTLVTGSTAGRDIPDTSDDQYVVAAVPSSGTPAIAVTDGSVRQTIALPSGKAGSSNAAVLGRTHRTVALSFSSKVVFRVSKGGRSVDLTNSARGTLASLDYWAPANPSVHPASPANAFLTVRLTYTDKEDPGKLFGFEPSMLKLQAGGRTYPARNLAGKGRISNVFEVPAGFTSGTLVIAGSVRDKGFTIAVKTAKRIPIAIAAG